MHAVAEPLPIARQIDPASSSAPGRDTGNVQSLARLLKLTMIPQAPRRMVAVFLGQNPEATAFHPSDLKARLMSQCLEGFVKESGGDLVYGTDFAAGIEDKEVTPVYDVITTDAGTFRFQYDGYFFIQLPGQRVVVELHRLHLGRGEIQCNIDVHAARDSRAFHDRWCEYTRHNHYLRGRAAFADGDPIIHAQKYVWDNVVLAADVRAVLRTHIEVFLAHAAKLKASGMKARRGLILAGPPGTGKTLVGKVLADTLGVSFLWVLPRHVRSTSNIVDIVEAARFLSPVVLLFEDIDLLGEDRETGKSALLGELMNQLDGVSDNDGIVAIATTNRLDVVERALRNRPGRFDRVIKMELPDENLRGQMLRRLLAESGVSEDDLHRLTRATHGQTPAQLEEVVNTLYLLAAERDGKPGSEPAAITPDLIDRAVEEIGSQKLSRIGFH